jgi:hypothetical protein
MALQTEKAIQKEHKRLATELLDMARQSGSWARTGEPTLTTEMVAALRDGRRGKGCYRRMSRLLQATDRSAADWLWYSVAELQRGRLVSLDASRPARGMRKVKGKAKEWVEWRASIGLESGTWDRLVHRAYEAVLDIQGNQQLMEFPELEEAQLDRYYRMLQKEGGSQSRLVMMAVLWVLAATLGTQVVSLRRDIAACPLVARWSDLRAAVGHMQGAVTQLQQVRTKVRGWMRAQRADVQGGSKLLVNWFAGWPMVMRDAADELGWEVVAVDNREGLGPPHRLNVTLDLLVVAPQFWRLEVASQLGIPVTRLGPNWFGIPCTTTARNDSANSTRQGVEVWYNYRQTSDRLRAPQHGVGTPMGDKARATNRLVAAVCWVTEDCGQSWAIENPDGQMKFMAQLRERAQWGNRLDYCRLWSATERAEGLLWQKMCCVWTRRRDGAQWGLGESLKCKLLCQCRDGPGRKHVGQIEGMTRMVSSTGMKREELKCRYPAMLLTRWLRWASEAEHRPLLL